MAGCILHEKLSTPLNLCRRHYESQPGVGKAERSPTLGNFVRKRDNPEGGCETALDDFATTFGLPGHFLVGSQGRPPLRSG